MYQTTDGFRNAKLITLDDPEYVAFMRRMADQHPSRGGPRASGEVLGGLVERCVRHWLSEFVPFMEERILSWEQRLKNGRHSTLYRELDGVWQIDDESICLFEMKLTYAENMERGHGIKQLDRAAETLFTSKRYQYILKRLVYIADEPIDVLDGLPVLQPNDEFEELGVIWVKPQAVTDAAQILGIELPENWLEPESREGFVEDPEREVWRQFAETTDVAEEENLEANPLAAALKRAIKGE